MESYFSQKYLRSAKIQKKGLTSDKQILLSVRKYELF